MSLRELAAWSATEADRRTRAVDEIIRAIVALRIPADPDLLRPLAKLSGSAARWTARTCEFMEAA